MSQGGASRLVLANNNPLWVGGHLGLYNGSFRSNMYINVNSSVELVAPFGLDPRKP